MSFELRQYQAEGVAKIRQSYANGRRAPLYVLPTGGGKTAVFSHISEAIRRRNKRATILVHRQELLAQASDSLTRLGVAHGNISPKFPMTREPIQVASVQTLVRRTDRMDAPDLIVIDEAHHSSASTYQKILAAYPRAHVLGVTATPCRSDGKGLGEIFDDMILGPSVAQLIEGKYLVPPEVYAPPIGIDLSGVKRKMGDYDRKEIGFRINKPTITGSAIEHYQRLCPGEPAIAFCVSVEHAEQVANDFRSRGIRAIRVDGGMDDNARRSAIAGLGNGTVDVLTSADLIGEGVDIPRVSAAILLRPTYSLALYLQQVGRALRPADGKTRALILDHVGNVMRHGFPDEDREWELTEDSERKSKKDKLVDITQCSRCYFVYETGPTECPGCGFSQPPQFRKIEVTDGELRRLNKEALKAEREARRAEKKTARAKAQYEAKQESRAKRREEGQASTLEELVELGKQRGYSNPAHWADKKWSNRKRK